MIGTRLERTQGPAVDRRRARARHRVLAVAVAVAFACSASVSTARADILAALADEVRSALDPRAAAAYDAVDGIGRKLLAARSYLRAGPAIGARWSWTSAEIARYEESAERRAADAEVDRVTAAFEESNPGYTLFVSRKMRSLESQISSWNENPSVGVAAGELETAARAELGDPAYADGPKPRAAERFRRFLHAWRPTVRATIAAPGLSPHGRLRAFDFQVQEKGGEIVARTSSRDVAEKWDAPGWTAKLEAAVVRSGARLEGPLESPREPWHYDYVPPRGE
jgi:hypothetical protein